MLAFDEVKSLWLSTKSKDIGVLAQLGEHLPYKQRVTGSSPVGPIWRGSSVGKSTRFIPVVSLVRLQFPLLTRENLKAVHSTRF